MNAPTRITDQYYQEGQHGLGELADSMNSVQQLQQCVIGSLGKESAARIEERQKHLTRAEKIAAGIASLKTLDDCLTVAYALHYLMAELENTVPADFADKECREDVESGIHEARLALEDALINMEDAARVEDVPPCDCGACDECDWNSGHMSTPFERSLRPKRGSQP